MKNLPPNKLIVKVRKTPMLLSKKFKYSLSDFAYGEWIIFENDEPKYYLNVFEEQYSQILEQLKPDIEQYLTEQFKKKGLKLSIRGKEFGIPLASKSEMVELNLEKLPSAFIIN